MSSPKISVVFTSFNHKIYLRQALNSILAQTFKDFELIIIDDCSTDGSQEILHEYALCDNRIRLIINSQNSGSYVHSTNQGAHMANAPYLIFAQCDDFAEPDQFEKLYAAITENHVAAAFSRSNLVDENGILIGTDFSSRDYYFRKNYLNGGLIKRDKAFFSLLHSCMIPNLSAAIISRDCYDRIGGLSSEYKVLADWDFWIKLSSLSDFYYISDELNNFRQHETTIRSSMKISRLLNEYMVLYSRASINHPESEERILHYAVINWLLMIHDAGFREWLLCAKTVFEKGKNISSNWGKVVFVETLKLPITYFKIKLGKSY